MIGAGYQPFSFLHHLEASHALENEFHWPIGGGYTSPLRTRETAELGGPGTGDRGRGGEYGSATCSHFIKLGETDLLPFEHIFYLIGVGGVIVLLHQLKRPFVIKKNSLSYSVLFCLGEKMSCVVVRFSVYILIIMYLTLSGSWFFRSDVWHYSQSMS